MKEPGKTRWASKSVAIIGAFCCALGAWQIASAQSPGNAPRKDATTQPRTTFTHTLPLVDGRHLTVQAVEVNYGPGESTSLHTHPCPVFVYVVKGTVRMQVKGEAEAIYKSGDHFYEAPNGVHLISANASKSGPAKFLAYFICDSETPTTIPVTKAR